MERTPRVVAGAAAVFTIALGGQAATAGASTRVLEGEFLRGAGKVVRETGATRGRALLLPAGLTATRTVKTGRLGAVLVRARGVGTQIELSVDGAEPSLMNLSTTWRERKVSVLLAAGRHTITIKTRRGAARIDRVRLRTTKRKLPADGGAGDTTTAPPPPLGPARHAVPLGTSVVLDHLRGDATYEATLRREFASLSPENELKMDRVQPERGKFDFAAADALVDYAAQHGKAVRGHTLIYGRQTPPWVGRILSAQDAEKALRDHVSAVVTRYKGRIREWDVVNEAFDEAGRYRSNPWQDKLGDRHVEIAFEAARIADPSAKLFYNEFNAETNNKKRGAVEALARKLKSKGLIDGIGLQMHTSIDGHPTGAELAQTMRFFGDIGLETQITEMDVIAKGNGAADTLSSRLGLQASIFQSAADACATVATCSRFTVWGVTDRYSWMGADQIPLLIDINYAAKPALAAVRDALAG